MKRPYVVRGQEDFYQVLKSSLSSDVEDVPDPFDIEVFLEQLSISFGRIWRATSEDAKEMAQRRGMDDLQKYAFSFRRGWKCDTLYVHIPLRATAVDLICIYFISLEQCIRIRSTPDVMVTASATADHLVTIGLEPEAQSRFEDVTGKWPATERSELFWQSRADDVATLSIIGFASEYKRSQSAQTQNQLAMDLVTAQSQRKALGLKNDIVYGATVAAGKFRIFASWWLPEQSVSPYLLASVS